MSLYCHGTIKVTTPGKVSYQNDKIAKIQFKGVSIDPTNRFNSVHSYFFEMTVESAKASCAEEIVPGIICNIHMARIESPEEKSFTKVSIYSKHFEILNVK